MNRVEFLMRIGPDGILHLDLPMGVNAAETEVRVIVEPNGQANHPAQSWHDFVESLAGSWQGDYERPASLAFERRSTL